MKRVTKALLRKLGWQITREKGQPISHVDAFFAVVKHLGFSPSHVVNVSANHGDWTWASLGFQKMNEDWCPPLDSTDLNRSLRTGVLWLCEAGLHPARLNPAGLELALLVSMSTFPCAACIVLR